MPEVQTTLLSVERLLSKKQKPFWKFTAANGKEVLAFRAPLAAEAQLLLGKPVTLEITEKPSTNPDYPEPGYFLDAITPDPNVAAPDMPLGGTGTAPNANGAQTEVNTFETPFQSLEGFTAAHDAKQSMIVRQSAFKAATFMIAGVYNGSGDFAGAYNHLRALTDELIRLGLTGQWDLEPQNVPEEAVPWEQ